MLRKGNTVKLWVAQCEGPGVVIHIAAFSQQAKAIVLPPSEESISLISTREAISLARELDRQIQNKINKIKLDFDREIAPNIGTGEKGEFETKLNTMPV
jgi:hypothetical protein